MKLLLIAQDFPPIPSPQSIRWAYLVTELTHLGHDLQVVTSDSEGFGYGGLPEVPESVVVHRLYPGIFSSWISGLRRKHSVKSTNSFKFEAMQFSHPNPPDLSHLNWKGKIHYHIRTFVNWITFAARNPNLNWKGRIVSMVHQFVAAVYYPDERGEWVRPTRSMLDGILADFQPDFVLTSHEPATSIPLGLHASDRGYRWVADLGDPVVAPYTPKRWKRRAGRLEQELMRRALLVTVTSDKSKSTLCDRYPNSAEKIKILTQGFTSRGVRAEATPPAGFFRDDLLELLYTGTFYNFRRADQLIDAVIRTPNARLTIGTVSLTEELIEAARNHPSKFRILGFVPHDAALSLQRAADVLINLANNDPIQIPGKLYEYFGSGRPVLHVATQGDVISKYISEVRAGWSVASDSDSISRKLGVLSDLKSLKGREGLSLDCDVGNVQAHAWDSLAKQLELQLINILSRVNQ